MVTSNSVTITVEPSKLSIEELGFILTQPGSCVSGNDELCSGGEVTLTVNIQGDLFTNYWVDIDNGAYNYLALNEITTNGSGEGGFTVTIPGKYNTASCFLGACLSNCSYTYTAYLYPANACNGTSCSGSPIATSTGVKISIDCSCKC